MEKGKELILTPEELYFMGTLLQAEVMDYTYIAALGDIGSQQEIFESTVKTDLEQKGIIMEDFSGNIEVAEEIKTLLTPVFFGMEEAAVDTCRMEQGEAADVGSVRFHFYEGNITQIVLEEQLRLSPADEVAVQAYIRTLQPNASSGQEGTVIGTGDMDPMKYERVIAVKRISVGEESNVTVYVVYDGSVYQENGDGQAVPMSNEDFCASVYQELRGE